MWHAIAYLVKRIIIFQDKFVISVIYYNFMTNCFCSVSYIFFFFFFFINEQGKISFKNLKRVAKELGENLTDEELQVC